MLISFENLKVMLMKHKFFLLYSWFVRTLLFFLPDQPSIMKFRGWMYGLGMNRCGSNFQVSANVVIKGLENFLVGDDCYLAPGVVVNAIQYVELDCQVMIGFNSVLVSGNHSKSNGSYRFGKSRSAPIYIGFGSWVAANSTVVAGASIGSGVVIGANSFVKGNFSDDSVYVSLIPKKLGDS